MRNLISKDPETNKVWMDIYYEKTDTQGCVPFKSCRQNHFKTNITFTLARRVANIFEKNNIWQKYLKELEKVLAAQGFPQNLIYDAIDKAVSIPMEELWSHIAKRENDYLAFATNNINWFPIVWSVFNSLQEAE